MHAYLYEAEKVYTCMCVYIRTHTCIFAHLREVRAYIYCMYVYNIFTYIHTHTHMHTCMRLRRLATCLASTSIILSYVRTSTSFPRYHSGSCLYIYIIYIHIYIYIYTYMHYAYVCRLLSMCINMLVSTCIYVCMNVWMK
jgi:hypothetical protein